MQAYERLLDRAEGWGFNRNSLRQHLRTALAVCLSIAVASALGLEHPQWSGMTVWAASQPLRGQMLEKSLFRVLGTAVGVLAGVLLLQAAQGDLLWLVTGLALWLGLCVGLGNLQRSFVSYGTMLAGYSAAMVALLDVGHPELAWSLGGDRLLTALTGVLVAIAVGWLFTPEGTSLPGEDKVRLLCAHLLRDLAQAAQQQGPGALSSRQVAERLSAMAIIEESLDAHGAGSLRSREAVRALRRLMYAQISALLWLRNTLQRGAAAPLAPEQARLVAEALTRAAQALETQPSAENAVAAIAQASRAAQGWGKAPESLANLSIALQAHLMLSAHADLPSHHKAHQLPVVLHSDWLGARRAMLRAFGAMFVAGVIWVLTGWSGGAYMLLGLSVMITVFSGFEDPVRTMRYATIGQAYGLLIALACQWLVWPLAHSQAQMVVMMFPSVFIGALVFSHRRTMLSGYDCNMVLLLLLTPHFPYTDRFAHSLYLGLAVLTGPLVAWAAYRFILPVTAQGRLQGLRSTMVQELQEMAATASQALEVRIWRARLYHRLLRLVRGCEKVSPQAAQEAAEQGLAAMRVGIAVVALHRLSNESTLGESASRSVRTALQRLQHLGNHPERGIPSLRTSAQRVQDDYPELAQQLREAADALQQHQRFFSLAG